MRRHLRGFLVGVLTAAVIGFLTPVAARIQSFNQQLAAFASAIGYVANVASFVTWSKYPQYPAGSFISFGSTAGINSYGLQDASGTIEAKNSGGGWVPITLYQQTTVTLSNAQILALPTVSVTAIPAPGTGFRIKVFAATWRVHIVSAYTGISPSGGYNDIEGNVNGYTAIYGPVDDSTTTPALTQFTGMLTTVGQTLYDVLVPTTGTWNTSPLSTDTYALGVTITGVGTVDNEPLILTMTNNGTNLTGGNSGNSATLTIYWAREANP